MRLDKTFSPELTNASSSLYQSLTSQINEAVSGVFFKSFFIFTDLFFNLLFC